LLVYHQAKGFQRRGAPPMKWEVSMTRSVLRVSAIALGAAAFVSFSPLSAAWADTSAEPAPTPTVSAPTTAPATPTTAAKPSLSEPAPTPGWAESTPAGATGAEHSNWHHARHYTRHYAWRNGHRYVTYDNNPVAVAANGVVGGVADVGSLAAYPFYCFPNYGSCHVHWYRY
jgi:hypothetical protein